MTGLWQVSGRSDVKFREMILLDLYYVENHSLMFDLEIMFETVPVVLFGKGAY
jgi:lipopolysaccharide/colanic/teichoic acid biosynthesis glycosyltransferase